MLPFWFNVFHLRIRIFVLSLPCVRSCLVRRTIDRKSHDRQHSVHVRRERRTSGVHVRQTTTNRVGWYAHAPAIRAIVTSHAGRQLYVFRAEQRIERRFVATSSAFRSTRSLATNQRTNASFVVSTLANDQRRSTASAHLHATAWPNKRFRIKRRMGGTVGSTSGRTASHISQHGSSTGSASARIHFAERRSVGTARA